MYGRGTQREQKKKKACELPMTTVMVDEVMWARAERRSCLYGSFQALGIKVQLEDMPYRNFMSYPEPDTLKQFRLEVLWPHCLCSKCCQVPRPEGVVEARKRHSWGTLWPRTKLQMSHCGLRMLCRKSSFLISSTSNVPTAVEGEKPSRCRCNYCFRLQLCWDK